MFVNQPNQQQLPINTYPKWKYVLIVIVLALAFLYAAPNIFGKDPAVQISGLRDAVITQQQFEDIEAAWQENNVEPTSVKPSTVRKVFSKS